MILGRLVLIQQNVLIWSMDHLPQHKFIVIILRIHVCVLFVVTAYYINNKTKKKGGTLWYVSSLIGAYEHDSIIVDGQSISDIKTYKELDNTDGWNPCLPVPFNWSTVTINFISTFRDWYPFEICDYQNNSIHYKNEYLFDGGKSLMINNLYINNYTIDNNTNYPILRSMEYFNASIIINNGLFTNISSSVNQSLFQTLASLYIKGTSFSNIQISNSVFYGYHDFIADHAIRTITFESSLFYNLSAAIMYQSSKSLNDVK